TGKVRLTIPEADCVFLSLCMVVVIMSRPFLSVDEDRYQYTKSLAHFHYLLYKISSIASGSGSQTTIAGSTDTAPNGQPLPAPVSQVCAIAANRAWPSLWKPW